jgi:hypothetical protein
MHGPLRGVPPFFIVPFGAIEMGVECHDNA